MKIDDFIGQIPKDSVIILRGPSGSGKSTLAKRTAQYYGEYTFICSVDHYFENPQTGVYSFDTNKLGEAHKQCMKKFLDVLNFRLSRIIVDNTNLNIEDLTPYLIVGEACDRKVFVVELPEVSPEDAYRRNVHNVPKAAIESMVKRAKTPLPKRFQPYLIKLEEN